jgi:hypothetical protein
MNRPRGEIVEQILEALNECGPMTRQEICDQIGLDRLYVSAVISRMTKATPRKPKRLYITGYQFDADGQRRYPRAIYDIGDKPNARRVRDSRADITKRYRERKRKRLTGISVFHLGLPRRKYEKLGKEI